MPDKIGPSRLSFRTGELADGHTPAFAESRALLALPFPNEKDNPPAT